MEVTPTKLLQLPTSNSDGEVHKVTVGNVCNFNKNNIKKIKQI